MSYFLNENGDKDYIFGKGGGKEISEKLSIDILGTIPINKKISESSDNGYPIILKEDKHSKLFLNICKKIDKKFR